MKFIEFINWYISVVPYQSAALALYLSLWVGLLMIVDCNCIILTGADRSTQIIKKGE